MKYFYYLLFFSLLAACENPTPNDLLPNTAVDITVNLNNPEFNNLLISGGWAYTAGGIKGILLYNRNGTYVAFERACPHLAPSSCNAMTFDGLLLKCTCDNSVFNIFNGGVSETAGIDYSAREYHVQMINSETLRITNF
jgi:nitrite reductase/ring-hydroxylating ferredoxin subunit